MSSRLCGKKHSVPGIWIHICNSVPGYRTARRPRVRHELSCKIQLRSRKGPSLGLSDDHTFSSVLDSQIEPDPNQLCTSMLVLWAGKPQPVILCLGLPTLAPPQEPVGLRAHQTRPTAVSKNTSRRRVLRGLTGTAFSLALARPSKAKQAKQSRRIEKPGNIFLISSALLTLIPLKQSLGV